MNPTLVPEQPTGEIEAHLMHAAIDGLSAVMQLGPLHLMGRLDIPDGVGEVVFVLDRVGAVMGQNVSGVSVRLEYWYGDTSNRFVSQVLTREGDRVRLVRPAAVDRSDRRMVPRYSVVGAEGFRFLVGSEEEASSVPLVDLSNTGLAFRCPQEMEMEPGMEVMAWVGLPGEEVVPVLLEIRNRRPVGEELLIGARMRNLLREHRKAITRLIIGYRKQRSED